MESVPYAEFAQQLVARPCNIGHGGGGVGKHLREMGKGRNQLVPGAPRVGEDPLAAGAHLFHVSVGIAGPRCGEGSLPADVPGLGIQFQRVAFRIGKGAQPGFGTKDHVLPPPSAADHGKGGKKQAGGRSGAYVGSLGKKVRDAVAGKGRIQNAPQLIGTAGNDGDLAVAGTGFHQGADAAGDGLCFRIPIRHADHPNGARILPGGGVGCSGKIPQMLFQISEARGAGPMVFAQ